MSAKFETLSKLFDFYIIWKPLMRGFRNGLIFLNLAKWFWKYLNFSAPKNEFFSQDLEGSWSGSKEKISEQFFAIFWE